MSDVLRRDYVGEGLSEHQLKETPWQQAKLWVDEAHLRASARDDVPEPSAMSVATVDENGCPDVRTVLLRFFDPTGPGFVTNLTSRKAVQLATNPAVAASLTWPAMYRSIRFRGRAAPLPRADVSRYFTSRPWGSRISAWASRQSAVVSGRAALEEAFERYAARWPDRGDPGDVPLPDFWGGYRIICDEVEFWGGRTNRLHDRLVFLRVGPGALDHAAAWRVERRQP